ncbi:MAG: alpha-ribazole phosphatase family protein [Thiohalocapsa sp.]|jgi:probable phosphoglycerate mutase|uniref:histidine phosphatase family protein n=1 Tax=Thiohalocapsa sp. TaxID=2497641 RepID=UPI0025FBB863|nr:alpha-ribazole phosphatase family protein [Thiohalocapsa sp.]MCG6941009.1 alpha-ribazole phosphatase family protein [Thiohalocapsa sp.]
MSHTVIDLIRHGEPIGGRMIRGNGCDHPLSETGWAQMRAAVVATTGEEPPWQQVVSSPMARCRAFAVELAGRLDLPLAVEPELREIGMGAWEGRRPSEVAATEPEAFHAFRADPAAHRPPGGEALAAFRERIARAYERQLSHWPGRHLLIVCHAGVTRAVLGHVLGAADAAWYRIGIDYAGVSRIRHGRHGAAIEYVNARHVRA